MNILNSIFGKKDKKSTTSSDLISPPLKPPPEPPPQQPVQTSESVPGPTYKRKFTVACPGVPFQASMVVSPDESMVCCITPNQIVAAYESGTNKELWKVGVETSRNCKCMFVGPDRLLVINAIYTKDYSVSKTLYLLVNTTSGRVVARKDGPYCTPPLHGGEGHMGIYIAVNNHGEVITVDTRGDKIEFPTWRGESDAIAHPRFGPDGKMYFILDGTLHRLDGDKPIPLQTGGNFIQFVPPSMICCGTGYMDRSGPSGLHIFDMESGLTSSLSWGNDPVSKIALAGTDHLVVASDGGSMSRPVYSLISLLSLKEQKKEWSITINDLPIFYGSLQTSAPEDGWALIQTGKGLILVALEDGKTLGLMPREPQIWTWAKWLTSKKLLYFAGNPVKEKPGLMECFKIQGSL
jgi:hypothetical protein